MTDNSIPPYFSSILIPVVAAFLGLTYPLILQVISRLDDKYVGVNISNHFKKNWAYVSFDSMGVFLYLIFALIVLFGSIDEFIYASDCVETLYKYSLLLFACFAVIQITLLLYVIKNILIYSDTNSFTKYYIDSKDYQLNITLGLAITFIKNKDVESFKKIFIEARPKVDTNEIIRFNLSVIDGLFNYDSVEFKGVRQEMFMFGDIFKDGSQVISRSEFKLMWSSIQKAIDLNDFSSFKRYWSYCVQYVHNGFKFNHPSELNIGRESTLSEKEWNNQMFNLKFFNLMILAYLSSKELDDWLTYIKRYKPSPYGYTREESFINEISLSEFVLLFYYFFSYDDQINSESTLFEYDYPFDRSGDHISANDAYKKVLNYFQSYLKNNLDSLINRKYLPRYIEINYYAYKALCDVKSLQVLTQILDQSQSTRFGEIVNEWNLKKKDFYSTLDLEKDLVNSVLSKIIPAKKSIEETFKAHFETILLSDYDVYNLKKCNRDINKRNLIHDGISHTVLESIISTDFKKNVYRYIMNHFNRKNITQYNLQTKDFLSALNKSIGGNKQLYVIYYIGIFDDIISTLKSHEYELIRLEHTVHADFNSGLFILRKDNLSMRFIKPKVDCHTLKIYKSITALRSETRLDEYFNLIYGQSNYLVNIDDYKFIFLLVFNLEIKFLKNLSSIIIHNCEASLSDGTNINTIDQISIN